MNRPLHVLCVGALAREAASLASVAATERGGTEEPWEVQGCDPEALVAGVPAPAGGGAWDAALFAADGEAATVVSSLRLLRARLRRVPIIAVVSPARRGDLPPLLREGAEDFLVAGETDGPSLRRVVRYALEGRNLEEWLVGDRDLFHRIWGSLSELVAVVGRDGRRLYNSPAYRELLGDPAGLLGTDSFREVHPDDVPKVRDAFERSFRTGMGERADFRFLLADGTVRHIESQGVVIPGDGGGPDRLVVVSRDVTEQRRAEAELREREEFYRRISENMSDLVAVLDPEGRRLYNSPSYRQLFGGGEPPLASDSFAEIHPDDQERIRRVFQETVATGEGRRAEFRFLLPNGRVRFLESVGSAMRDEAGRTAKVLVVSRDTTERRQAEEALARERNLLRTLIDLLPDFIYVKDRQGRFVLNNVAHARLVGLSSPTELVGRTDWEVFPAELAERYAADDEAVARRGERVLNREEPVLDHQGHQLWVLTTKVPLLDLSGEITGLVGMSRDITERRRAEHELRQSQERFELVIRGSRDGIWDWNVETDEVYFSPRWKGMLGYAPDEIPDTFDGWKALIHPEDRDRAMRTIEDYFAGSSAEYALEHRLRHKDGSYRWILARGVALRDASGRPLRMAGSHVDLTERRRTEERLRQAARWESVTTLAAGVAHEVKNPLQTILLGVEFLAGRPGAGDPAVAELLASMRNAAGQADTIIRTLRDYALQRQPQCRPGSLHALIEASLESLGYDFHRNGIQLVRSLQPDLPPVCMDAEQMRQVCWIVLRNAIDAVSSASGTRRLAVTTALQRERPDGAGPADPGQTARGWVVLHVEDNGPGIPPEVMPKVFDLFFTTKVPGKGTGIGLALARKILESHHGLISLANRPGGGVRVSLALPVPASPLECADGAAPGS